MAIFIVSLGSAVATTLIISALQSNEFSRDNLVGLNLAVEGMETMRGVRDANWLKFSFDKNGCWNMRPEIADCKIGGKIIEAGKYTIDLNVTANKYSWGMTDPIGSKLDLDNPGLSNDPYQLFYYDIDTVKNSDNKGGPDDDKDILATKDMQLPDGVKNTGPSNFYRMIEVNYTVPEEMDVTSTVQWRAQGVKHQVVLSTKLTNYQKFKAE